MVIHERSQNEALILEGSGRMDFKARHVFQNAMKTALASETHHIVVDLQDLSFVDSAGIALLMLASKDCHQTHVRFSLCQPQGCVKDILELANLHAQIPIFDSLESALALRYSHATT